MYIYIHIYTYIYIYARRDAAVDGNEWIENNTNTHTHMNI